MEHTFKFDLSRDGNYVKTTYTDGSVVERGTTQEEDEALKLALATVIERYIMYGSAQ